MGDAAPRPAFRFHHLGVAVTDVDRATPFYRDFLGYSSVGAVTEDPIQRVRVCFLRSPDPADPLVELVAPMSADSPLNTILAKGGGAYHACYCVDRIESAISAARAGGCLALTEPVPAAAFDGRRIAWLYSPGRQLIELLEGDATVG